MAQFRKRPVVIEAFRYYVDPRPDWFQDRVTTNEIITFPTHCEITTLEGVMRGAVGDFIIQGIKGEIYPCKPGIFEATYEKEPPMIEPSTTIEGGAYQTPQGKWRDANGNELTSEQVAAHKKLVSKKAADAKDAAAGKLPADVELPVEPT